MPTDEGDQDGDFFQPPREGGEPRCLGVRSHCYCCLDPIPPTEGGGKKRVVNSGRWYCDWGSALRVGLYGLSHVIMRV